MARSQRDKGARVPDADGDATGIANVTDIWTFARDTASRNPNWILVATEAPN